MKPFAASVTTDKETKLITVDGAKLFVDTLAGNYPYWHTRTLAGIIFAVGMLFFVYNVLMTIRKGRALERSAAPAGSVSVA